MEKYTLPKLPYGYDSLEPHFDSRTMEIHHLKHHQTYLDKLNASLEKYPEFFEKPIEILLSDLNNLPEDVRLSVKNNGGGFYHHSLFWNFLSPNGGGNPSSSFKNILVSSFGDFDLFKEKFSSVALSQFGSGWAWLVEKDGRLDIISTSNQDSPVSSGYKIIIGLDVWEHAYYLNYQNRRADYITAWWNLVNWSEAERRFNEK
ncbi:MAG: superoxide dismutase [Candidatus Pacebacteria bacterium]|nr:superoxide dismutase [Candidatus Paceibacterota bacterium]